MILLTKIYPQSPNLKESFKNKLPVKFLVATWKEMKKEKLFKRHQIF